MPQFPATDQMQAQLHTRRICRSLESLGIASRDLGHYEAAYLPHIIHFNEQIKGLVYGFQGSQFAYLVATDKRVIYIDTFHFNEAEVEIPYDQISATWIARAPYGNTVTLIYTTGSYKVLTFNLACAQTFSSYLDARCHSHRTQDSRL